MSKANLAVLCMFLFILILPSASYGQAADWTFMVYLDADNNLEGAGIGDINEMEEVGSDANINIVALFDRIPGYDSSNGNWTGSKIYYITHDTDPAKITSTEVADWGEANMGNPATLEDFALYCIDNYPASHYALVLWDHGGGWRARASSSEDKPMKAVCWDDSNGGDCLYMDEVETALSYIHTQRTSLDLFGFDACLMGMLEVAYEVKDHADIMVFSEQTIPYDGWPYDMLLGDLAAKPAMGASMLGQAIVTRYGQSYGPASDTTLSSLDLGLAQTLATTVSDFGAAMASNWDEISSARAATQDYYYPEHIDLYDFADNVSTMVSDPAIQAAANSVKTAVANAVLAEFHGSALPGSNGVAIYFPQSESSFDTDYLSVIDMSADHLWDDFLQRYYESATAAVLSSFEAKGLQGAVKLSWLTEMELDCYGWNILRSKNKNGPFYRINAKTIPGAGTTNEPQQYSFIDRKVAAGTTYFYYLQEVYLSGETYSFNTNIVQATAKPRN